MRANARARVARARAVPARAVQYELTERERSDLLQRQPRREEAHAEQPHDGLESADERVRALVRAGHARERARHVAERRKGQLLKAGRLDERRRHQEWHEPVAQHHRRRSQHLGAQLQPARTHGIVGRAERCERRARGERGREDCGRHSLVQVADRGVEQRQCVARAVWRRGLESL